MSDRETTSKIIDEIIRYGVGGSVITLGLLLPGSIVGLHKPLALLLDKLDERERERKLRRVLYQMRDRGLLAGDYKHGLQVTDKARKRLHNADIDALVLHPKAVWDGRWRIVIYDIPEEKSLARHAVQQRLLRYGCVMLQKSTWITPFPCRGDIVRIAGKYDTDSHLSYFEAVNLDNAAEMLKIFKKRYPNTLFKIPEKQPIG